VQNAKYSEVKQEIPPVFFQPYRQNSEVVSMNFYVRTSLDPEQFLPTIPPIVSRLDANLPVEELRTMTQQIRENVVVDRILTVLSTGFAGLATLLAAVGLYGVLAYTVTQRTREIGVRMALGAAPGRIRAMVLRQVGWMTLFGAVIGLGGAVALGRVAESLLFQLKGYDPSVLATATALIIAVALLAALAPAHRASRVDPIRALRYE
jgi:ABC-type antimicrobial peptide transport system permease subunit